MFDSTFILIKDLYLSLVRLQEQIPKSHVFKRDWTTYIKYNKRVYSLARSAKMSLPLNSPI